MTWQKTDGILKKRLNQLGFSSVTVEGRLCHQVDLLCPDLVRAVSAIKSNTEDAFILNLELQRADLIKFKMQEGDLLKRLNYFAQTNKFLPIKSFRLTFLKN
jgi:hypothetical protein